MNELEPLPRIPMTTMEDLGIVETPEQVGPPKAPPFYMTTFTVFDVTTGEIRFRGNCTNYELEHYKITQDALEGYFDYASQYVDISTYPPSVKTRPRMELSMSKDEVVADGNEALIIYGVPENTLVKVTGPVEMEGFSTGQDVELVFAVEGKYTVNLDKFPYISERFDVNATGNPPI